MISKIVRIATNKRASRALIYNGMVFVGGQTADDRSQDIERRLNARERMMYWWRSL